MKKCADCNKMLPKSDFYRNWHSVRQEWRYQSYCRPCHAGRSAAWRKRNPAKAKARDRTYSTGLPHEVIVAFTEANPPCKRDICGKPEADCGKGLHLDHCHETMTPRGWLCLACNTALGNMEDNTDRLEKAIEYLRSHRSTAPALGSGLGESLV